MDRLQRIRRYLKTDLRVLRWVFGGLYVAVLGALLALAATSGSSDGVFALLLLVLLGCGIAAQCMFIFGAGTIRLCQPMRKRRLVFPIVVASFMFGLLGLGLLVAMEELIEPLLRRAAWDGDWIPWTILGAAVLNWLVWGVIFWQRYRLYPRHTTLVGMVRWLLVGSLLEVLVCVPAHIVVSRRPGCLVGLGTMLGIVAGLCVMVFAFGPAIVLLFLRPRHRAELAAAGNGVRYCDVCGYDLRASVERCPECGTAFGNAAAPDRR